MNLSFPLAEGSLYEGSFENEGSICGSDSTFYQQTEGMLLKSHLIQKQSLHFELLDKYLRVLVSLVHKSNNILVEPFSKTLKVLCIPCWDIFFSIIPTTCLF